MDDTNNRKKSTDNIEDIKAYQYIRFCCLLDFFEISVEELCDVYEDGTKHEINSNKYEETTRTDYVMQNIDYFKYKLPKYNSNKKALNKFIEAFIIILENKEFEFRHYTKEIMCEAKEKILKDAEYEIIYDYDKFYNFFSELVDYAGKIDFIAFEKLKTKVTNSQKEVNLRKMSEMFLRDNYKFNFAIILEIFSREIAITFEYLKMLPVLQSENDIIESLEIRELLCANWDMFQKIYEDGNLAEKFIEILMMKRVEVEKEKLLEKALQIDGKQLLENAKNYSYLLHYVEKRISKNKLDKFWENELLETQCGVYYCIHRKELKKLKHKKCDIQGVFETLFYYACTR